MATTTELVQLVADDTGLDQSFSGVVPSFERALILRRLNQAYRRLVGEHRLRTLRGTFTLTPGQETYLVGPGLDIDLPNLIGFKGVNVSDNAGTRRRLTLMTEEQIERGLTPSDQGNGYPNLYSYNRPEFSVWPRPQNGAELQVLYYAQPNTLVEDPPPAGPGPAVPAAGEETVPSSINPIFHESVLAGLATLLILRGYEGRPEEAQSLEGNYQNELRIMRDSAITEAGTEGARETWLRQGPRSPDVA
jgi:hypothetical protein